MVVYKTDPKQLPPPDVQPWEVAYARRVPKGTPAEINFSGTGVTYDPGYEYYAGSCAFNTPTPALSGPVFSAYFSPIKATLNGIFVVYKPDGTTNIGAHLLSSGYWWIPSQSDVSAIISVQDIYAFDIALRIQPSGLFETQWLGNASQDGHCVIARRRRYG